MHRFIYTSTASTKLSLQSVAEIAGACFRNNHRSGLSGMLIMHQDRFFHVLEGEEVRIQAMCTIIQNDLRHQDYVVVQVGRIRERAFVGFDCYHETPARLPLGDGVYVRPLRALLPPNSLSRGRDAAVRHCVRDFLSSFEVLLVV